MEIKSTKDLFDKSKGKPKLLTIFAHPDDESICAGSVIIDSKKQDIETFICCLSNGEKGVFEKKFTKNIVEVRKAELSNAAEFMNINKLYLYDIEDSGFISNKSKLKKIINKLIAEVRPTCIITHDPSGITNHPDHIVTSEIVFDLINDKYKNSIDLYFSTITEDNKAFRENNNTKLNFENLQKSTHEFNIDKYIDDKKFLYDIYDSQNISRAFSIPLELWFSFNNYEVFHKVDFNKKYLFKIYPFNRK